MTWWNPFARAPRRRSEPEGLRRVLAVVRRDQVLQIDGECVDDAADYVDVVARLVALCGGDLAFDEVSCEAVDSRRVLLVRRGERAWRAELAGRTDWIDTEPLLDVLNTALADQRAPGRLWSFDTGHRDQTQAHVYLLRAQAEALLGRGTPLTSATGLEPPTVDEMWSPRWPSRPPRAGSSARRTSRRCASSRWSACRARAR